MRVHDPATGWDLTYPTDPSGTLPPPGGIVLQNLRHAGHNFAKEIRVLGLRLTVEHLDPSGRVESVSSHFLPLSDPPFSVGPIDAHGPVAGPVLPAPIGRTFQYLREADEALWFRSYFQSGANAVGYVIKADYTTPPAYFAATFPNCETAGLTVSQRFLFSRYANDPRHEPSGNLLAARCHPIVRIAVAPNDSVDRGQPHLRVASIRVDYRLHLYLDPHLDPTSGAGGGSAQNAGLFRDEESALSFVAPVAGVGIVPARLRRRATSAVAFAAVEKPLALEVATLGLRLGLSAIQQPPSQRGPGPIFLWDNVHWWGARGPGQPTISAPGAFHAAHLHWRWGAAGSSVRRFIPEIDTSGVPTIVQSDPIASGIRGALVDPAVWIQTLRIAVTKEDGRLDPNARGARPEDLVQENWSRLFTTLRAQPLDIHDGADLVLWYSAEVHRAASLPPSRVTSGGGYGPTGLPTSYMLPGQTLVSTMSGSVFLHGIFFAHDPEPDGMPWFGVGTGSRDEQYSPRSLEELRRSPQWERFG